MLHFIIFIFFSDIATEHMMFLKTDAFNFCVEPSEPRSNSEKVRTRSNDHDVDSNGDNDNDSS